MDRPERLHLLAAEPDARQRHARRCRHVFRDCHRLRLHLGRRDGNIPLVAIGGIKFEQAAEIFAAGADSIAVVSDVTQNADPDARVRAWLGMNAKAA